MDINIAHLAGLACLRIKPEEMAKYESEMKAIIDMVSGLPALDDGAAMLDPQNPMVLRPDVPVPSMRSEDLLRGAPGSQAGCFLIPRTVE